MTSLNSVLQKFFNLPPAVRMALAVAGFGSLASIIYFLLPALRTKQGRIWLLIIAGCALVLVLLIWGLRRLFFGRKSSKLAGALESQGPTRGDIAEQEQVYRNKFQGKLTELKANGLSVYRLPWFVLIGEPGCGKTASLIHSGLDFPLGKDEVPGFGGTRNYNWWFTNDAVILDTAGRIAFQEEGTTDKIEWEFFLKLLKRNRQRCPINGVIIALPADKLLRDTSEERAQKATILRERLRQVHQTLGVRFPTSVLITKMDLVGGFSEFFEEIRVDLQQRNQMFGWSRPGEFQDPYEPSGFPEAFDQVYHRLRDWSMRYLQRKATEEELGLVVTFPEAFRELCEPLGDYISTIFQKSPLLEPPFFRGFYFTSAVQEGAPIFDVFTRGREGVTIPERPTRAVDSKAFFIHDLYERKVFPEAGLVFRSAQHVTLNQRMRRLVWVGTVGVLLVMIVLFTFGFFGVGDLVNGPKVDCAKAVERIERVAEEPASYKALAENIELAKRLEQHYRAYDRPLTWVRARALFIGANINVPRQDVRLVHARLVLDTVVAPVLRETGRRLQLPEALTRSPESYDRYVAAATVYARWYGSLVGTEHVEALTETEAEHRGRELGQLLEFLEQAGPVREDAVAQFTAALTSLAAQPRSFGHEILGETLGVDADELTEVLAAAVRNLSERWLPLTRLEPAPQDPFLRYWFGVATRIARLRAVYDELLHLGTRFLDAASYGEAVQRFELLTEGVEFLGQSTSEPSADTLARAWYDLRIFLADEHVPQTDGKRILRFADQLPLIAGDWNSDFDRLLDALRAGAPTENAPPQERVYRAIAEAQSVLDRSYERSWLDILGLLDIPAGQELVDYCRDELALLTLDEFTDINRGFDKPEATVQFSSHPFGRGRELAQYLTDLREAVTAGTAGGELGPLTEWPALLTDGQGGTPRGEALSEWFSKAQRSGAHPNEETIRQASGLREQPFWRPPELYAFADSVWAGYQRNSVGAVLARMQQVCEEASATAELPGLARLMPGFDRPAEALPFRHVELEGAAEEKPAEPAAEPPPEEEEEEDWRRPRRATAPAEPSPTAEQPDVRAEERLPLVRYHTRDFLADTLRAYDAVRAAMDGVGPRGEPVIAVLDRAADAYIDRYFLDWNGVYDDYFTLLDEDTLRLLQACRQGRYDWLAFQEAVAKRGREIATELGLRFEAIVREVLLFGDAFSTDVRGEALFDRVDARLRQLGPQQDLQRRLSDIGRRTRDLRRGDDPVQALGDGYAQAWLAYVRQVKEYGERPGGVTTPPDRRKLRADLEDLLSPRRTQLEQFRLVGPLLDIATYGDVLLANHLDRELAKVFEPVKERYPFVADARDEMPFARLGRLAETAVPPAELLEVLRRVDRFRQDYGKLMRTLHSDAEHPSVRVLDHCAAWVEFLYGPDAERLHRDEPSPLKVKWAISKHEGTASAGIGYTRVTITLPLLSESGIEAVGPIEAKARSGFGESLPPKAIDALATKAEFDYRWSLFRELSYAAPGVRVWDRHQTVLASYPAELNTQWQLPGRPESLLLLIGADAANRISGEQWTIPVLLKAAAETIGFDLAIQFERPFPGPCAPAADPGPPQKMSAADQYLQAVPARSGP